MTPDTRDNLPRLYDDLAAYWPILSPPSDYETEAALVAELLDEYLPEPPPPEKGKAAVVQTLLELGAGGGHTLCYLAAAFECVAVDLSASMLDNCQKLVPDAHVVVGDMRTLNLYQPFDAVLIHDAIDYMTTQEDAHAAVATAARHLDPGGVCLIAPTYTTESFEDGESVRDQTTGEIDGNPVELDYTSTVRRTSDSTFDLTIALTAQIDGNPQHIIDTHHCGLFSTEQWTAWMQEEGFTVDCHDEEDRPAVLLIGVKQ